jgi:hypothetical protein
LIFAEADIHSTLMTDVRGIGKFDKGARSIAPCLVCLDEA